MMPSHCMSRPLLRAAAFLLSVVLIFESVGLPLALADSVRDDSLNLPKTVADIATTIHAPNSPRIIYHIQDVHNHIPSQINLSEIVSFFESKAAREHKKLLVGVEGVSGEIETDSLSAYPNKNRKKDIAAGLLKTGILYGEEYAALVQEPGRIKLVGIESVDLYRKNYFARERSNDARTAMLAVIGKIKSQLAMCETNDFNLELIHLQEKRRALEQGIISTVDYVKVLFKMRPDIIEEIASLRNIIHTRDLLEPIDNDAIFADLDTAEIEIASSFIKHSMAGELLSHMRWVESQERFFALSMIPAEWKRQQSEDVNSFLRHERAIKLYLRSHQIDLGYIFEQNDFDYSLLRQAFSGASDFYKASQARDTIFAQNFLSALKQDSKNEFMPLLIMGGFHTLAVSRALVSVGYTVVVIRPKLETSLSRPTSFNFNRSLRSQYQKVYMQGLSGNLLRDVGGIELLGGAASVAHVFESGVVPDPKGFDFRRKFPLFKPLTFIAVLATPLYSIAGGDVSEFVGSSAMFGTIFLSLATILLSDRLYALARPVWGLIRQNNKVQSKVVDGNNISYLARVLDVNAGSREKKTRNLFQSLRLLIPFLNDPVTDAANYVGIDFEEWREKKSELLNALTVLASLNAGMALSSPENKFSLNHIVIYFSGEPDASIVSEVSQLKSKLNGLVFHFVTAPGAEKAFQNPLVGLPVGQKGTLLTRNTATASADNFNVVNIVGSSHLALATFVYAKTKDPVGALKILLPVFESLFHLKLESSLTDQFMQSIVAAINA